MPDKKISELIASAALDGSESVPIVQGAQTKKATTREIAKFGYQDVITDSTAARTLSFTDRGAYVRFTNATGATLTVPTNASVGFAIGETFNGIQAGSGKLSIVGAAGVTINLPDEYKSNTRAKGAPYCLIKVAADAWDLIGDLEAM